MQLLLLQLHHGHSDQEMHVEDIHHVTQGHSQTDKLVGHSRAS